MSDKSFAVISITAAILCAVALAVEPPGSAPAVAAVPPLPAVAVHAVVPQAGPAQSVEAAWKERKADPRLVADGK